MRILTQEQINALQILKDDLKKDKIKWETALKENDLTEASRVEKKIINFLKKDYLIALLLIHDYKINENILFDIESHVWYMYQKEKERPYLWSIAETQDIIDLIDKNLMQMVPFQIYVTINYETRKRNDLVEKQLQNLLKGKIHQKSNKDYVIFQNTVIDVINHKDVTSNCGPNDFITEFIDHPWNLQAKGQCIDILNGLRFMFSEDNVTRGQEKTLKLFQAICQVVLKSNKSFNLQFFVELYGHGGTGKSLLVELLQALILPNKFASTQLNIIETSRYETAVMRGKNLVIFPETQGFIGEASTLKAATGGDYIRSEEKGKQPRPFKFYGVAILTTNQSIRYSQSESSILRRRIALNIDRQLTLFTQEKNLIQPNGLWHKQLPGFIQWIFEMDHNTARKTIDEYLEENKHKTEDFEMSYFLKNNFIPFKDGQLSVSQPFLSTPMYTLYEDFCNVDQTPKVSKGTFLTTFPSDFASAFPGYNVQKKRRSEGWYFTGLMYIQVLPKEIIPLTTQIHKDSYGVDSIHTITYNEAASKKLKAGVLENQLKLIRQNNTWHEYIGLAVNEENKKLPFNSEYNKICFIKAKINGYQEEKIKKILPEDLQFKTFLALAKSYDYDDQATISNNELLEDFKQFIIPLECEVFATRRTIKPQFKEAWDKLNPDKPLFDANNIGKNNWKGLRGIKKKVGDPLSFNY